MMILLKNISIHAHIVRVFVACCAMHSLARSFSIFRIEYARTLDKTEREIKLQNRIVIESAMNDHLTICHGKRT